MSKLWYSRRGLFGTINEEQEIHGRQKVVRGLNVPVLTSHAGLNPRSKSGYEPERRVINHYDSHGHDTVSYARVYQTRAWFHTPIFILVLSAKHEVSRTRPITFRPTDN